MNNKKTMSENVRAIQSTKPQINFGSSPSKLSSFNGVLHKKPEITFVSRRIIINPYLQEWEKARLVGWPYYHR